MCVVLQDVSVGRLRQFGCVRRWFFGCLCGWKTGGAVAARRADRQRGGQNKIVVASTRCWRGVFGLGRVSTLGSGGLATLGCGVNKGVTLGGDIG